MHTRRQFFRSLLRNATMAAAMAYAPSSLLFPKLRREPEITTHGLIGFYLSELQDAHCSQAADSLFRQATGGQTDPTYPGLPLFYLGSQGATGRVDP